MKWLRFTAPAVVVFLGIMLSSTTSYGKPEYTKKEKKACTVCHVTAKSKELNEAGKYYDKNKTLEGFKADKK
jgi:hypothetical protein